MGQSNRSRYNTQRTAASRTREIEREASAKARGAASYADLEKLAGVTDRDAFWAQFGADQDAGRNELSRRAMDRLAKKIEKAFGATQPQQVTA